MERHAVPLRLLEPVRVIAGHLVGWLVAHGEDGPRVDYPGNAHGPLPARTLVALEGRGEQVELLLVFDGQRSDRPIVTGIVRAHSEPVAAQVDGRRVVLDAEDELVLRCGKASITLRRNGRVSVRGVQVETRAEGVNRIQGGSVQIN